MNLAGKLTKISPCTLRLLTPALLTRSLPLARPLRACGFAHIPFAASQAAQVSFSEEREKAGATSAVEGFNVRSVRGILSLVVGLFLLTGCAPQERVAPLGSDFSFVYLVPMNPDHHPATRLHYKSKEVWPIVFDGFGYFVQDGVVVFVGLLPYSEGDGSDPYQQLLAVRGGGVPLLLSERLLHQKYSSARGVVPFRVESLSLTNGHFRVEFKQGGEILTREFSWADVNRFLDEGESSGRLVINRQVDYRVLP